jgi:2-alkenal reductase
MASPGEQPRRGRSAGAMLLAGAVIGGVVGGALGSGLAGRTIAPGPGPAETFPGLPTPAPRSPGVTLAGAGEAVVEAVRELGPSVVTVVQKSSAGRPTGSGSGFVIEAQRGYIATNSHVVSTQAGSPAASLDVTFSDERTVSARLVGRDPETDVAVLQIETAGLALRAAVLGDSDEVPVGATVVAIGSALGDFRNSVTSGVLSGKGRRFPSETNRELFLEDLVQTDAPISPGNSGGPLIWAATRQVVGMNTLVVREPGSEGLGFAVSSNTVRQITEELIRNGRVERGRIGIAYQVVAGRSGQAVGLPAGATGILVTQVQPGSPGAQAGLRVNDVVTKLNDIRITPDRPLPTIMLRFRPGDRVRLTVFRDGREQVVEVTLGR